MTKYLKYCLLVWKCNVLLQGILFIMTFIKSAQIPSNMQHWNQIFFHSNTPLGSAAALLEISCNPKCTSSGSGVSHEARQSEAARPLKQTHSSHPTQKGVCGGVELTAQAVSLHCKWPLQTSWMQWNFSVPLIWTWSVKDRAHFFRFRVHSLPLGYHELMLWKHAFFGNKNGN